MHILLVNLIACKVIPLVRSTFFEHNCGPYIWDALYVTVWLELFTFLYERYEKPVLKFQNSDITLKFDFCLETWSGSEMTDPKFAAVTDSGNS